MTEYRSSRRNWIKLWVDPWLDGTTRYELTSVQRCFWVDLMALAGRSRTPGVICAGHDGQKTIGYPLGKFQSLLREPLDIEEAFALFVRKEKITLQSYEDSGVRFYVVTIRNWERYQSEYQRQKTYRKGDKQKNEQVTHKVTNQTPAKLLVEGEVEGEVEEKISSIGGGGELPANTPPPFDHPLLRVTRETENLLRAAFPTVDLKAEYPRVVLWIQTKQPGMSVKDPLGLLRVWCSKIPASKNGRGRSAREEAAHREALAGKGPDAGDSALRPEAVRRFLERGRM